MRKIIILILLLWGNNLLAQKLLSAVHEKRNHLGHEFNNYEIRLKKEQGFTVTIDSIVTIAGNRKLDFNTFKEHQEIQDFCRQDACDAEEDVVINMEEIVPATNSFDPRKNSFQGGTQAISAPDYSKGIILYTHKGKFNKIITVKSFRNVSRLDRLPDN